MGTAFVVEQPTTAALRALNYTPEVEALRSKRRRSVPLGRLLSEMGPAYGTVFVRRDCARDAGIELITQGDMFATEPNARIIRLDSMPKPERHRVRRWQVLISGAGTLGENELYGRSIIADERLVDRFVGPHAMALTFKEPGSDENLFAYAFLCSPIGIRAVRSTSFGTKILGVRKDLLAELPIPDAPPEIKRKVAALIRRCVEKRETYHEELRAARRVLEDLPEMREARAMCEERRARCVEWKGALPTLSAWTYASPGEALQHLLTRWRARFGDVLEENGLFYGGRSTRIPCTAPHGVDFVAQRDAFLIRPVPKRVLVPGIPSDALFVKRGGLVIAGRGTLGEGEIFGRPVLIAGRLARCGLTEDLLRVAIKDAFAATAYAFLSTLVGLRLTRSTAVGTKILNLRFDLLRALPFPEVGKAVHGRIGSHIRKAIESREDAEQAEAEAIRIIEEEVLPAWLA